MWSAGSTLQCHHMPEIYSDRASVLPAPLRAWDLWPELGRSCPGSRTLAWVPPDPSPCFNSYTGQSHPHRP